MDIINILTEEKEWGLTSAFKGEDEQGIPCLYDDAWLFNRDKTCRVNLNSLCENGQTASDETWRFSKDGKELYFYGIHHSLSPHYIVELTSESMILKVEVFTTTSNSDTWRLTYSR